MALLEKVYTTGETLSLRGHQAATDLGRGPTFWDMDFIALPETEADGGQPVDKGVLIIARDVTRQILSERAGESLRATEARLNIALEAADLGAWSARNEATEFMSSPHAAVLHGLSPDTVVDHETAMSVIHPDDRAAVWAALERAIAEKGIVSVEYRAMRPGASGEEGGDGALDRVARALDRRSLHLRRAVVRHRARHNRTQAGGSRAGAADRPDGR